MVICSNLQKTNGRKTSVVPPVKLLTPHSYFLHTTVIFFVIFHLRWTELYVSLVLYIYEQLKLIPRHFWASGALYQVPGQEKHTSEDSHQEWRGTSRNRLTQTGWARRSDLWARRCGTWRSGWETSLWRWRAGEQSQDLPCWTILSVGSEGSKALAKSPQHIPSQGRCWPAEMRRSLSRRRYPDVSLYSWSNQWMVPLSTIVHWNFWVSYREGSQRVG